VAKSTQITDFSAEKVSLTLVFKKNANFFAQHWQRWPKIVITTLT
jgi:hypothetical protein